MALPLRSGGLELGIVTEGQSLIPEVALFRHERTAMIGYDQWLHWVDLEQAVVAESLELLGVFYEFLPTDVASECIVVTEIAVVRTDDTGRLLWQLSTDILSEWRLRSDGMLLLKEWESGRRLIVSQTSGEIVEVE